MMTNRLAAAAATMMCVLTTLTFATAARGATSDLPAAPTARIATGDLNLASADGASVLKRRIRGAAEQLCLSDSVEALDDTLRRKQCYRQAVADGVRQMDGLIAMRLERSDVRIGELHGELRTHAAG
jgi:UrcA family protein